MNSIVVNNEFKSVNSNENLQDILLINNGMESDNKINLNHSNQISLVYIGNISYIIVVAYPI